jgi:hypothetical protein
MGLVVGRDIDWDYHMEEHVAECVLGEIVIVPEGRDQSVHAKDLVL